MKLVMQENFGLKKKQSVISNVGPVKPMMQENFGFQKKSKVDKQHRTSETDDARQLRLTNKRKAYKSKMSLLNNQKRDQWWQK